jgi:hypothetical protein
MRAPPGKAGGLRQALRETARFLALTAAATALPWAALLGLPALVYGVGDLRLDELRLGAGCLAFALAMGWLIKRLRVRPTRGAPPAAAVETTMAVGAILAGCGVVAGLAILFALACLGDVGFGAFTFSVLFTVPGAVVVAAALVTTVPAEDAFT